MSSLGHVNMLGHTMKAARHKHLPHLSSYQDQPIVYFTLVAHSRKTILACETVQTIMEQIWGRSASLNGWFVGRHVIMPDHMHFFARPGRDCDSMSKWMRTLKSISARRIIQATGHPAPIWQADYFDRYIRSSESYSEKWNYVVENPVRKELVKASAEWPWQGEIYELEFD